MTRRLSRISLALIMAMLTIRPAPAGTREPDTWSKEVNGLQARLSLVEKPKLFGTRWLVPSLELNNVRNLANPMEVRCDARHLKVELVDAEGKPVNAGRISARSGPAPVLETIVLPWESFIRIGLECHNWGVPKDAPAMISTDSGAWVLKKSEKGRVYLRATLTGEKAEPEYMTWHGRIQTPLLRVDWE